MSASSKMRAFGFYQPGHKSDPPPFEEVLIDKPAPTGRDLLVEVKAISVNPTDWRTHQMKDEQDASLTIVGRDAAGVVVGTGPDCSLFKEGDAVYYAGTNIRPGCHSEYHLVDERLVGKKPTSLNFAQAASMALTSITAWEALFERLHILRDRAKNEGKSILIIGAAGGVGSIATQLASMAGLQVIGTASRPESIAWAKKNDAQHVIDHHKPFAPQLQELGLSGVHYVFVLNEPDQHLPEISKVILPQGKICTILRFEKPTDLSTLFYKSATLVWELMYTRSMYETEDMITQHDILNEVADLLDQKKLQMTMTELITPISAENLREAYRKSMTGRVIGKIVLEGFS